MFYSTMRLPVLIGLSILLAGCDLTGPDCVPDGAGWSASDEHGYVVLLKEDLVTPTSIDDLVEKYDLKLGLVFPSGTGFSAEMSRSAYEGLWCERVVKVIGPNGDVGLHDLVGTAERDALEAP